MEVVMKNVGICLATAFILTLLNVATASARDFCGMTQAICPAGTFQLAADSPVKPRTHSKEVCAGQIGLDLKKCLCKAEGTADFPCTFSTITGSCRCQ
jgi:hypothetical protein